MAIWLLLQPETTCCLKIETTLLSKPQLPAPATIHYSCCYKPKPVVAGPTLLVAYCTRLRMAAQGVGWRWWKTGVAATPTAVAHHRCYELCSCKRADRWSLGSQHRPCFRNMGNATAETRQCNAHAAVFLQHELYCKSFWNTTSVAKVFWNITPGINFFAKWSMLQKFLQLKLCCKGGERRLVLDDADRGRVALPKKILPPIHPPKIKNITTYILEIFAQ